MKEWVESIEHERLGDEDRAILDKFETPEDAHVGYVELQKAAGKPFKLPDSLDKLDENASKEFKEKVSSLIGHDFDVISEENINEINFADGLADARSVSEDLKKAFSQFAVENKMPRSLVQKLVTMNNKFGQEMANKMAQDRKTQKEQKLAEVKNTLAPLFGGEDGLKENNEAVRRMYQNHSGLTAEEYEKIADPVIGRISEDPVFAKAQYNLAKQYKESSTETTSGGKPVKESTIPGGMEPTAKVLKWK